MDEPYHILDKALEDAIKEANRRLKANEEENTDFPPVETPEIFSDQINYRQPAQLEARVTKMTFDPLPPPLPEPEGFVNDALMMGSGGEYVVHQWKTTASGQAKINVREGWVYTQSGFAKEVAPAGVDLVVGGGGYAVCKITRETSSRAIESAEIEYVEGEVPVSSSAYQYAPLAQVLFANAAITRIIQLQFEELHIYEALVVSNGSFELADLRTAGRNPYSV